MMWVLAVLACLAVYAAVAYLIDMNSVDDETYFKKHDKHPWLH